MRILINDKFEAIVFRLNQFDLASKVFLRFGTSLNEFAV